jgi:hypothetical protein
MRIKIEEKILKILKIPKKVIKECYTLKKKERSI